MEELKTFGEKIQQLIEGKDLTRQETYTMFREVLMNKQPDLQQGAFLAALVAKGETVQEIAGAWQSIDELDTVHTSFDHSGALFENSGTGMDQIKTFNVSSAAAIVAAAGGVTMARHGARALTSCCGTVDILESLGVNVECPVEVVEKSIREAGIGLFNGMSPEVHPGALGRILSQIRFGSTLNIAASLANPARPTLGLRGVYSERLVKPVGEIMREIGYTRGMVVYGRDDLSGQGMDEISLSGETVVHEFSPEYVRDYVLAPEEAGLKRVEIEEISYTGDMKIEISRFLKVLAGKGYPACVAFTCLNAGAILYVAGKCATLKEGVERSKELIERGLALEKLHRWVSIQEISDSQSIKRLEAML